MSRWLCKTSKLAVSSLCRIIINISCLFNSILIKFLLEIIVFWCRLWALMTFLQCRFLEIFGESRTCSIMWSSTTQISKPTLWLPMLLLIWQTSNGIMITYVLLIYQSVLISISWIVLHLNVINEILFSLVLIFTWHSSSVWRLISSFRSR